MQWQSDTMHKQINTHSEIRKGREKMFSLKRSEAVRQWCTSISTETTDRERCAVWLPGTTGRANNAWTPCHKVEKETSAWTGRTRHTYAGVHRLASGRSSTWRTVRAFSDFQVSLKNVQHLRTSLQLFIQKYLSLSSQCWSRFALSHWHFLGASRKTKHQKQNTHYLLAEKDKYIFFSVSLLSALELGFITSS